MRISRSALAALILALAGLTACGDDDPERASEATTTTSTTTTSSSTTTTTATSVEPPHDETCSGGESNGESSPSTFDPAGGQYAVILMSLDVDARTIGFDVFQLLFGADAIDAYHQDFPDDPEGPPNDYYTVNENPLVRSASVDPDVVVRLVRLQEDGNADLDPGIFEELPTYLADYHSDELPGLSYNPYWLTFEDGAVTDICEQYVP